MKVGIKLRNGLIMVVLALLVLFGSIGSLRAAGAAPEVVGMEVYTDHTGPAAGEGSNRIDDQHIYVSLTFDQPIKVEDEAVAISQLLFKLNGAPLPDTQTAGSGTIYTGRTVEIFSVSDDGNTLNMKIHFSYAPFSGRLEINPKDGTNSISGVTGMDGTSAIWPDFNVLMPTGAEFIPVDQTLGDAASGTKASVTKEVYSDEHTTRGMVHIAFLVNGEIYSPNTYGASFVGHYHDYLGLTPETFAAMLPGVIKPEGYDVSVSGNIITVTAQNAVDGQVLDLRTYVFPKDRDTQADKSGLQAEIARAQGINESLYTEASVKTLKGALAFANAANTAHVYLQYEIDEETAYLTEAINGLVPVALGDLEAKILEGEALDPENYTAESYGVLEQALIDGHVVLANPLATADEVQEAISAIDDAIDGLVPAIKGLPETIEVEVGKSVQFTPMPAGGIWEVISGEDNVRLETNSPATIWGVKEGTAIVRYTSPQELTQDIEITVKAAIPDDNGNGNNNGNNGTGNNAGGGTGGEKIGGGKVVIPKTGSIITLLAPLGMIALGGGLLLKKRK